MDIIVNGERRETWTASEDRDVCLTKSPMPIFGRVLSRAEASRAAEAADANDVQRAALIGVAVTLLLLLLPMTSERGPSAGGFLLVLTFGPLFVVGVVLVIRARAGARFRRLEARLDADVESWAETGAEVRVDADAMTVAGETYPWAELRCERIEITGSSDVDSSTITVERLVVAASGRRIVLDRLGLANGGPLVDAAYVKLIREGGLIPGRNAKPRGP